MDPLRIEIQTENVYQVEAWNKSLRNANRDFSKPVLSMQGKLNGVLCEICFLSFPTVFYVPFSFHQGFSSPPLVQD